MKNIWLTIFLILIFSSKINSHSDGAIPYWYPSSYIFGFIKGCADTIEISLSPMTKELWPEQIRSVCGCVIDSLRHSITFQEATDDDLKAGMQLIVSATMPICMNEELKKNE